MLEARIREELLDKKGGVNSTKIRRDLSVQPLIDELIAATSYLPESAKIGERIYQVLNRLTARPVCKICKAEVALKIITQGYSEYCGAACATSSKGALSRAPKIKAALLSLSAEDKALTLAQRTATNLERYGYASALHDITKRESSMLVKHGVKNPSSLASVVNTRRATNLERYGVINFCKLDAHKDQIAKTHRGKKLEPLRQMLKRAASLGYEVADAESSYLAGTLTTVKHSCGSTRQLKLRSDSLPACHECLGKNSSAGEHLVRELLLKHLPQETVVYHDRTQLAPFELDFWLPGLKLGIEFHGSYWHSVAVAGSTKHQEKALLARAKGVKLIQVLDESQLYKLEARLISLCMEKLHARKLTATAISVKLANEFCAVWHRQGEAKGASMAYGLYNDAELVSVILLGKPRFAKQHSLELFRACSAKNVRGGFGKLFAAFITEQKPTSVISYADLLWGSGETYKQVGFRDDGVTAPGYLWVSSRAVYTRYEAQKHKLPAILGESFDVSLTEAELMSSAGYFKVFDAGNVRYVWDKTGLHSKSDSV